MERVEVPMENEEGAATHRSLEICVTLHREEADCTRSHKYFTAEAGSGAGGETIWKAY